MTPTHRKLVALTSSAALWLTMTGSAPAVAADDPNTIVVKSFMFGVTITAVGCLEGLNTTGGAEQVGRSTTRAVVMSIFLVIMVDLVFTMLFYFLGEH